MAKAKKNDGIYFRINKDLKKRFEKVIKKEKTFLTDKMTDFVEGECKKYESA